MQLDRARSRLGRPARSRSGAVSLCRRGAAVATLAAAALAASPSQGFGDGQVTVHGAYYKERSTRVMQPMIDARFDVGDGDVARAHILVDSITSASVAAGSAGTPFTERRVEGGAGYMHQSGQLRYGGSLRYSTEPDYKSIFATLRGELDLAQKDTVLTLALSRGHDNLDNSGAQGGLTMGLVKGVLDTTMVSMSVTQVLSPIAVAGITYDLTYLNGFQENPYRLVTAGGALLPERLPQTRLRHAIFAGARVFVPPTRTTLIGGYRLYLDDWGIVGNTPEVRIVQALSPHVSIRLRYRYYHQNGANFYRTIYDTADPIMQPYLTSDDKLGPMTTQTFGAKISSTLAALGARGRYADVRADLLLEYVTQTTHYGNAVIGEAGVTVPFDY